MLDLEVRRDDLPATRIGERSDDPVALTRTWRALAGGRADVAGL